MPLNVILMLKMWFEKKGLRCPPFILQAFEFALRATMGHEGRQAGVRLGAGRRSDQPNRKRNFGNVVSYEVTDFQKNRYWPCCRVSFHSTRPTHLPGIVGWLERSENQQFRCQHLNPLTPVEDPVLREAEGGTLKPEI